MLKLEMAHEDWRSLFSFLQAATEVRALIGKAAKAGKQQVTVAAEEVVRWLDTEVPPEVWIKLGSLMASTTKEDHDG